MTARLPMARAMTEDELLTAISEAATWYGWRWFHIRRSDRAQQMGHSGFPDLILVRGTAMVAVELKTEKGQLTVDQQVWLDSFTAAGVSALVIRPSDLDSALRWLR